MATAGLEHEHGQHRQIPNRRVTEGVNCLPPYFKDAESVSRLGLAQNQGFGLVLG